MNESIRFLINYQNNLPLILSPPSAPETPSAIQLGIPGIIPITLLRGPSFNTFFKTNTYIDIQIDR